MLDVRAALDALTLANDGVDGKSIYMYGEGWNFGEVANNARGVNATQANMAGTGIGTFSDRLRDAVRGISPFAAGADLLRSQGFANGSYYDPTATITGTLDQQKATLLLQTDQTMLGMAGNLANYVFTDRTGKLVKGSQVDYNGQPAGYTADPQENISYIDKHDNQTLFDINVYAAPTATSMADRVRIENVGRSTILLGQGVPFIHAGGDILRSKSLDRDSYNSGDWFNKIDWTYESNNFGVGLPPARIQRSWDVMRPLLGNAALEAGPGRHPARQRPVRGTAAHPLQLAAVPAGHRARHPVARGVPQRRPQRAPRPDRHDDLGPRRARSGPELRDDRRPDQRQRRGADLRLGAADGRPAVMLHPVQGASVDPVVKTATYDAGNGKFTVPARTTAVWVEKQLAADALVTFPGSYPEAAGLGGNWAPDNQNIKASDANNDSVWKFVTDKIPAGNYEFKAAVGGAWSENYGVNGAPGGDNVKFTATTGQPVAFYYDRSDNYVTSRPGAIIPAAVGSFASEIGGADWSPDNLTTWMKDKDGDGVYTFATASIPPGNYEFKVALNEGWDEAYPANNLALVVPAPGATVTFSFNKTTKEVKAEVVPFTEVPPPPPPTGPIVTFPGSYPEAAGLGGNWAPDNLKTQATDDNKDGVWKFVTKAIPAGSYEFKAAVGKSWDENYGVGGKPGGDNVKFTVAAAGDEVSFYYDRGAGDNWVASRPNSAASPSWWAA